MESAATPPPTPCISCDRKLGFLFQDPDTYTTTNDPMRCCQTSRYIYSTIITLSRAHGHAPLPRYLFLTTTTRTSQSSLPVTYHHYSSTPVPVLSPSPPASPIRPLGYRAAMIRLRAEAASTSLIHYHYHHPSYSPTPDQLHHHQGHQTLHLYPLSDRKEDKPEVTLPPRKRLGITLGSLHEEAKRKSASAAAARPVLEGTSTYCSTHEDVRHRRIPKEAWLAVIDYRVNSQQPYRRQSVITERLAADHKKREAEAAHKRHLKADKETQTQMTSSREQLGPAKVPHTRWH
ncbi:hypothetical protein Tco_0563348 [Tanacetum coccineum]